MNLIFQSLRILRLNYKDQNFEESNMASPTKRTDLIRERKKTKAVNKRKAKDRNQGTTKTAKELFQD